ncbi:MAG: oligopeptide-binding protein oppA [Nitrospinae bacterium CG11_big_fil_rev_8_21_14_0_20_56_8]|nr:MAG: oligopeptide-binding protein oppA [Nitrospinae bacterium CG11_big_fil_rev_8_21_14_0_20_56_8]
MLESMNRPDFREFYLGLAMCAWTLMACSGAGPGQGETSFRLSIRAEPPTLDWTLATDSVSFQILTNIMEGLTEYNANLEPVPALAERWETSEDGRTLRFYLRAEATWTDGVPVTAQDFEYSWKRLLDPKSAAQYAYFLFDIENAYEYNTGEITDPSLVGVRAVSPRVLEVRLKKPVVYFPSITTFMVTFPQRQDIVEKYGDRWTEPGNIVTNGPFVLDEWRHEYKLALRANPRYYGPPPKIATVLVYVVEEVTTALTLYETGELDVVDLPPVAIPHYRNRPEYRNLPQLRGYYYGFNVEKPPFDDARVRRAFAHAVDRSRIPVILQGGELPATSWIPKGMFGYNPDIGAKFDPEKARALLAEAGFPGGRGLSPVTAVYNTTDTNRLIAEFLQAQWKEHLGVNVDMDSQEWKVFLNHLQMDPPQLFRLGWGADFPDPDNFMNLFISNSGNNRLRWANPRYDELVARGAMERDPKARQAIYDEAQILLTGTEVPMIPLFVSALNMLVQPYVKGLELNALEIFYLKKIWLDRGGENREGAVARSKSDRG